MKAKKILSYVLAITVLLSMFTPLGIHDREAHAAEADHWSSSFLNKLADQNILRGDQNGNFNPDNFITRAEFAAMLNRAFGFEQSGGRSFSDVNNTAWYADDISFASHQGYMQGSGDGRANPGGYLTREEAVTMLCRALKIEAKTVDTLAFQDSRDFAAWSRGYINSATEKGMLSGYPDGTFRPGNRITRGEVAKVLATVSGQIVNQPSQSYMGYVNGNVTLSKTGAGLRNTVITGDLYITEGVLAGYIFLDNVTVLGSIIISGAGESNAGSSCVVLTDCDINNIIVDVGHNKIVSLLTQGNTTINNTTVKSDTYLEEGNSRGIGFNAVELNGPSGTKLNLAGDFKNVTITGPGNLLNLNRGNIDSLTAGERGFGSKIFLENKTTVSELFTDSGVEVTGKGEIANLTVGANGTKVDQMPDEIIIRPGVTAVINGKQMNYLDAEMENASPRILGDYPQVKDITVNSASGQIKANKPGTVYWMVRNSDADEPTEKEMRDPKNAQFVVQSGNMPLALANIDSELTAKVSGLKNGGGYDLYVMLVDSKDKASRVRAVDFETLDKTAPAFIASYPKGAAVYVAEDEKSSGQHELRFDVVPTKDSTIYWIIVPEKAAAPTPERLYAGNGLAGEIDHGTRSAGENTVTNFLMTKGLEEDTPYDIYMGLKDSRGNLSPVSKMTLRTKDVTPPEFKASYPKAGSNDKTIDIQYMTNESATLYWVALARGSKFPPGAPADGIVTDKMGQIVSFWTTEAAKQAVMTGNSSQKYGNTKTTADKPGQFTISGLATETAYDVYLVLVDVAGNEGTVGRMEVTTKNLTAPTAKMVFDQTLVPPGENPPVGSDVTIAFSHPVYAINNGTSVAMIELAKDKTKLANYIKFYDASDSQKVTEVAIKFENVRVSEDPGYTIVVFPTTGIGESASPDAAIQVKSGGSYYFELKGKEITNMSGKEMETTKLDRFQMKAPFVDLRQVAQTNPRTYDIVFEVEPKIKDAVDTLYYENYLETNRKITFDLYEIGNASPTAINLIMETNRYYSMQYLIENTVYCAYTPFNQLKTTQYGIKITAIEGNTDKNSWNGSVTVNVRGVAGTLDGDGMDGLTANGQKGTFTEYIQDSTASVVSNPSLLSCIAYFEDMVPPEFKEGYPKFFAGDTTVETQVMLDKPATVYYIAAPKKSFTSATPPPATISPPTSLSQDALIGGTYRTAGSKWGFIQVPNGDAVITDYIRDLEPLTEYYIFYLARGTRPSAIQCMDFKTGAVTIPEFSKGFPIKSGQGNNEAYVDVLFGNAPNNTASAEYYWAAYPAGQFPAGNTPTVDQLSGKQIGVGASPVDYGSDVISAEQRRTITVKYLKEGQYYDFFITAKNPLGNDFITPVRISEITPRDMVAPGILSTSTGITDYTPGLIPRYSGELNVTFTKPLYYDSNSTGVFRALADSVFKQNYGFTVATIKSVGTTVQSGSSSTSPINGIKIVFENASHNATITFPFVIGDDTGNRSGYLQMKFVNVSGDPESSYWDVKFVDRLN